MSSFLLVTALVEGDKILLYHYISFLRPYGYVRIGLWWCLYCLQKEACVIGKAISVAPPPGMISLTLKGNPTRKCPIFDG
jgi:hypothetical protein